MSESTPESLGQTLGPRGGWDKPPLGLTLLAGRLVLGTLLLPFLIGRLLFGQFGPGFLAVAAGLVLVQLAVIFGLIALHQWALVGAVTILLVDALVSVLANFWPLAVIDLLCVAYLVVNRHQFDRGKSRWAPW